MKTNFTLTVLLFIGLSSFANRDQSRLSVMVAGHGGIYLLIDNRNYQGEDNSLTINGLDAGYHTIEIRRINNDRKDNHFPRKADKFRVIYRSRVDLKSGTHIDITINRFGKAMTDERPITWFDHRDDDMYDEQDNHYDRDDQSGNGRPDNRFLKPVDNKQFLMLRETLRREPFENKRLALAKQFTDENYVTTDQVKQLLPLFSFEKNKLELAKQAYRNTTDKGNYYLIHDAFYYSHTKEELEKYIRENQ